MLDFDIFGLETPYYIVDKTLLERNLKILHAVAGESGAKILLAQKAFSMFSLYPLIKKYLTGTTASGYYEARLAYEEMGGEVHIFSPAYSEKDFDKITDICNHIVFNSFSQYEKFSAAAKAKGRSIGLRVNPEFSTQEHGIYDPCSAGSRLGITRKNFANLPTDVDGLHFHTLCEQNSDALESTLNAFNKNFGEFIPRLKWLNFGGGHHITRDDYDRNLLIKLVRYYKDKYGVEVYLEPGEAVALNAGFLVSSVVDFVENSGITNAILDASAACHMPDVIEMPYRPRILGAGEPGEKKYTYRLGGPTCLAGDIIGDYSFDEPLTANSRLIFCDMAIYSMVKNNTFNGMPLPSIATAENGTIKLIKQFNYSDFKNRLS